MADHVEIEQRDAVVVARLRGDLDLVSAEAIVGRVRDAVASHTRAAVLDLDGVEFLDSSAIGQILRLDRDLRERGRLLVLAIADDAPVRRALEVSGALSHLQVALDADAAAARATRP